MLIPRTPCLTPEEIDDLVTDRTREETRYRLERHLASCPRCRQEVESQREFEDLRRDYEAVPPVLADYDIREYLGRGGFGHVWKAFYRPLEQLRALKVLRSDCFGPEAVPLLRDEAMHMAALGKHSNRVQVFDLLQENGATVLVMEHVAGGPLSRLGRLRWERALRYVADAAAGLEDVRAAGRVHRDIKPGNLLLDPVKDAALLADYNLMASVGRQEVHGWTPGYAAPEAIEGMATAKSDVFSLAATAFALLTGRPPFVEQQREAAVAEARAGLPAVVAALAELPRGVEAVIRAGLEPDESKRPDLAEFHARLLGVRQFELAELLREKLRESASAVRLRVTLETANPRELVFRRVLECDSADGDGRPALRLRSGDLLRIAATADADGHVTVVNFGSSGAEQLLLPNAQKKETAAQAGKPRRVTFELTPPSGTDRVAVVWSRDPGPSSVAACREWIDTSRAVVRNLAFLPCEDAPRKPERTGIVVAVTHGAE